MWEGETSYFLRYSEITINELEIILQVSEENLAENNGKAESLSKKWIACPMQNQQKTIIYLCEITGLKDEQIKKRPPK